MKRITAIVRAEKLEALKDALFAIDVRGMTIVQVQGLRQSARMERVRTWHRSAAQHHSQGAIRPCGCRRPGGPCD